MFSSGDKVQVDFNPRVKVQVNPHAIRLGPVMCRHVNVNTDACKLMRGHHLFSKTYSMMDRLISFFFPFWLQSYNSELHRFQQQRSTQAISRRTAAYRYTQGTHLRPRAHYIDYNTFCTFCLSRSQTVHSQTVRLKLSAVIKHSDS